MILIYCLLKIVLGKNFKLIFSDFDIACAKRLFKDCIRNNLKKDRCILMMTQQKKFLNECDLVLVMKSGKCMMSIIYFSG
jgi:hypothetical protein